MFPPSSTGSGPAPRIAAVSALVVVLPFVPVTPTVEDGREAQEQVDLADDRDAALGLDGSERRPEAWLGRREAAAHRRRGADERLADERGGRVDVRGRAAGARRWRRSATAASSSSSGRAS